jgi:transcriptional activator of cad operon
VAGETTSDERGPATDPEGAGPRLESWKEIAAYLRRDVRTVQRWEQTDGLPIHRHRRAHRPIPYAYKAELDAWWIGQSDRTAPTESLEAPIQTPRDRRIWLVVAMLSIAIVAAAGAFWATRPQPSTGSQVAASTPPEPGTAAIAPEPKSVAVLPFADLTEGMTHEEFADGMAEEIINRLHAVPGYRVPAPASTFYFKNKNVPVADIARALRVVFVVDGSVRRSGATVRVAVRLIRADGADVVWSETYDRPWNDVLRLQDDVAGAASQAIARSIEASAK